VDLFVYTAEPGPPAWQVEHVVGGREIADDPMMEALHMCAAIRSEVG
jgi:hypothetical protein